MQIFENRVQRVLRKAEVVLPYGVSFAQELRAYVKLAREKRNTWVSWYRSHGFPCALEWDAQIWTEFHDALSPAAMEAWPDFVAVHRGLWTRIAFPTVDATTWTRVRRKTEHMWNSACRSFLNTTELLPLQSVSFSFELCGLFRSTGASTAQRYFDLAEFRWTLPWGCDSTLLKCCLRPCHASKLATLAIAGVCWNGKKKKKTSTLQKQPTPPPTLPLVSKPENGLFEPWRPTAKRRMLQMPAESAELEADVSLDHLQRFEGRRWICDTDSLFHFLDQLSSNQALHVLHLPQHVIVPPAATWHRLRDCKLQCKPEEVSLPLFWSRYYMSLFQTYRSIWSTESWASFLPNGRSMTEAVLVLLQTPALQRVRATIPNPPCNQVGEFAWKECVAWWRFLRSIKCNHLWADSLFYCSVPGASQQHHLTLSSAQFFLESEDKKAVPRAIEDTGENLLAFVKGLWYFRQTNVVTWRSKRNRPFQSKRMQFESKNKGRAWRVVLYHTPSPERFAKMTGAPPFHHTRMQCSPFLEEHEPFPVVAVDAAVRERIVFRMFSPSIETVDTLGQIFGRAG